jgi:hypothetical protein
MIIFIIIIFANYSEFREVFENKKAKTHWKNQQ